MHVPSVVLTKRGLPQIVSIKLNSAKVKNGLSFHIINISKACLLHRCFIENEQFADLLIFVTCQSVQIPFSIYRSIPVRSKIAIYLSGMRTLFLHYLIWTDFRFVLMKEKRRTFRKVSEK